MGSVSCELRRPPPPDHQSKRNGCGNDQDHKNNAPDIDSCTGLGFPGGNFFAFARLNWLYPGWLDLDWPGLDRLCFDLWLRILHWHREARFGLSIAFRDSSSKHLQGADLALTEGIWPS